MSLKKTSFMALGLGILAVGIVYIALSSSPSVIDNDTTQAKELATTKINPQQVSSIKVLGYQSEYGPLPNSLQGTILQKAVLLDEQGNLFISQDLMRIFNFFLSTSQEEALEIVIARIKEYLAHYLQGEPLSEALVILDQYIDMKKAMVELEQSHANSQDGSYLSKMENILNSRSAIREQYLSLEVAQAFYGRQDQLDQYTLSRMKVAADNTLNSAQKAAALEEINAHAPADLVASRAETQLPDTLREQTSALMEEGASEADIRALRVELVGEEATQRFETLDQERAQWQSRVDSFLKQRQDILNSQGITQQQQSEQISLLRDEQFDSREKIRIKAYERSANNVR